MESFWCSVHCHYNQNCWVTADFLPLISLSSDQKSKNVFQVKFNLEHFGKANSSFQWVISLPIGRVVQNSRFCRQLHPRPQGFPFVLLASVLLIISMVDFCRCESCGAVFHSECKEKSVPCPRCVRRELQKKQKSFWQRLNMDESLEEACTMFELSYQNTWLRPTRRPGMHQSPIHQPQSGFLTSQLDPFGRRVCLLFS